MKKIIKLNIENTTNLRGIEDSFCEVYSHDRNNGSFEFEITNDTLANETVTALFKFLRTGGYWKTTGTIEDNKIKVKFDTSLITQDETVVCFLYLDDEERTTDFYRFKFKVKVSEIDKLHTYAVKERYFNNSIIVDKLDVVTKDELKEALKGLTVSTVEGLLTETRADEIYAKKSEIYDDTSLRQRVATLEERPDNNTVYDDTALTNRVKALEDRPTGSSYDDSDLQGRVRALEDAPKVNVEDFATKDDVVAFNRELNNKVSNTDFEAFKTTIPEPYNDKALNDRVLALENRPSTGGGNVDVNDFVTKNEFEDFQQTSSLIINETMYDFFEKDSFKKDPEKDGYIGKLFLGVTPEIVKGERDGILESVEFQQLMRALVDVLPNQYYHIEKSKITFLTDRNFKEMVATPEFKAVVKESLRDIVKEIIKEEN